MSDPLNKEELAALPVDELFERLKGRKDLPRHVAIIMDGNGRWARKRFLPRVAGHRAGRHSVRRCVQACGRLGIEYLTLYTFSQENFNRPEAEVKALMHFLQETLVGEREDLRRQNVRLVASGDLDQLPAPAREGLLMVIDHLKDNTGLCLNLALAYGDARRSCAPPAWLRAGCRRGRSAGKTSMPRNSPAGCTVPRCLIPTC